MTRKMKYRVVRSISIAVLLGTPSKANSSVIRIRSVATNATAERSDLPLTTEDNGQEQVEYREQDRG
jgi:hypothetical protein